MIRGVRGAITVVSNSEAEILSATKELLNMMLVRNNISEENISSIIFSMTPDLDAVFPARAARELGMRHVALFCTQEIDVSGSLGKCIRILMDHETERTQKDINHVYLRDAVRLRPDISGRDD
ncbi:MAG: chorismate mutase [Candidatus Woesearchaeota archaeon]